MWSSHMQYMSIIYLHLGATNYRTFVNFRRPREQLLPYCRLLWDVYVFLTCLLIVNIVAGIFSVCPLCIEKFHAHLPCTSFMPIVSLCSSCHVLFNIPKQSIWMLTTYVLKGSLIFFYTHRQFQNIFTDKKNLANFLPWNETKRLLYFFLTGLVS